MLDEAIEYLKQLQLQVQVGVLFFLFCFVLYGYVPENLITFFHFCLLWNYLSLYVYSFIFIGF